MFQRLPLFRCEVIKEVIVENVSGNMATSQGLFSPFPGDLRLRDNPHAFGAARISDRVFLGGEDGGTFSTRAQMIEQFFANSVD